MIISILALVRPTTKPEKPQIEISKPAQTTETLYYTVKPGDTLDVIARYFGTTWEKLWQYNKDIIKDPNVIQPGQRLEIGSGVSVKAILKPISQVEFNDRLYKLMFRQLGMTPETEDTYNAILRYKIRSISESSDYRARQDMKDLREAFIGRETHELSKSITAIYAQDREMAYLIAALAWRETGFHNRRGEHGELGYYQFLPSTINDIYGKDQGKIAQVLVEENPWFATQLAVWYLRHLKKTYKTWNQVLYHYNGDPDYSGLVMRKVKKVKEIMGG